MQGYSRTLIVFATFLALALSVTLIRNETIRAEKGVAWKYNFESAVREAAKSNKPIMIDFYADWYGWCKKLDKDVYTDPKVIEASRKFVAIKLDADENREILQRYEVQGLPTVTFLKPDTKEISRVVGYRSAEEFLKEMNKAHSAAKPKKK
jgi:thiol:disulfide interchange protein